MIKQQRLNGLITLGKEEEYLNLNVVADKVALEAITDVGITGVVGGRTYWRYHCSASRRCDNRW